MFLLNSGVPRGIVSRPPCNKFVAKGVGLTRQFKEVVIIYALDKLIGRLLPV